MGSDEKNDEDDQFDNDLDDNKDGCPTIQYFSRKNSVLRIPIPPRASNRMLGKRIVRLILYLLLFINKMIMDVGLR